MSEESDKLKIERDITAQIKEQTAELLKQSRDRQDMSTSMAGYLEALKKVSTTNKTILDNEKEINKLRKKGDDDSIKAANLLHDVNETLKKDNDYLISNIKEVNTGTLAFGKGLGGAVKLASELPTIFKNIYTEIKKSGLFELDKSMKRSSLQMGLLSKETDGFRSSITETAKQTQEIGVGIEELSKIQSDYADNLGRNVMMTKEGLKFMGEMAAATGLGAEGTAKMAADMDNQGLSANRTGKFIEQTMNDAHKMGLNASKVIKNIQANFKMLNKYNFKGGAAGLAKMAETTTKLGVDMNFVGGMADKLFDIEGAVDMSAQLQVMGGEWAKLADPFKLMYMARNDMEGLTEAIGKAAESSVHFNKETGEFDISALEMHRLRKVAEQTGVAYEDLATAGKNAAKFTKIKTQISWDIPEEDREFLTNKSFFEDGKAKIELGGSTKLISQLTTADKTLLHAQVLENKSMAERAKESRTFDDALTNTLNLFKISMIPLINTINTNLLPKIDGFVKRFQEGKWGEKIEYFAEKIGKMIAFFGGWVLDNPIKSAFIVGGATLAKLVSPIWEKASWIMNGVMLSKGFNAANKGGGFMDGVKGVFGGGKGGKYGETGGQIGPAEPTKGGGMKGKGFGKMGKGAIGGALIGGMNALTSGGGGGEETGNAIGGIVGGIAGTFLDEFIGPFGTMLGAEAGSWIGGKIGGLFDDAKHDAIFNSPIHDGISKGLGSDFSKGRGIIDSGRITPIDNSDSLMAYKPGGPIDNSMKATQPANMKIDFGEIRIRCDELKVTSPGSPSLAIDLMKDPMFLRNLTRAIHVETDRVVQGGKSKS